VRWRLLSVVTKSGTVILRGTDGLRGRTAELLDVLNTPPGCTLTLARVECLVGKAGLPVGETLSRIDEAKRTVGVR
jgi:hypothetical protein